MPLPPLNTYQDPEALTPPDPDYADDPCHYCGEYWCSPDCTPRWPSPYRARMMPRTENRTPEGA